MLTKEQIEELVKSNLPNVMESLKTSISESIVNESRYAIAGQISKLVAEWCQENLAPEVTRILFDSKDGFIKAIGDFANQLTEELASTMLADAKKNLEQSWNRSKIIDALLK